MSIIEDGGACLDPRHELGCSLRVSFADLPYACSPGSPQHDAGLCCGFSIAQQGGLQLPEIPAASQPELRAESQSQCLEHLWTACTRMSHVNKSFR